MSFIFLDTKPLYQNNDSDSLEWIRSHKPIFVPGADLLRRKEIISILVEGGGETLGSFVDSKIIDKVYAFHAPIIIGGKNAISIGGKGAQTIQQALQLKNISYKKFDDNLSRIGYVEK